MNYIALGNGSLKTKLLLLMLVMIASSMARDIILDDTRTLVTDETTPFYFPVYTADGKSILMTQNAYSGLWVMNRSSEEMQQLTNAPGAGYHPRSLSDGSIIFRHDEYEKGRKFTSLYKANESGIQILAEKTRFVSAANMVNDRMLYLIDETPIILNGISGLRERNLSNFTTVLNDKLTLKLFRAGTESIIAPQGDGNYIWSEVSPDGDMLVYTKTGDGTFVCNMDGSIISELGYAHAAQWSPDGQFIVYMKDLDDGTMYTESEIWIVTYDGDNAWQITDTPDRIEMYPQWAPDGHSVVYHTLRGEIIETSFEIVD